MALKYFKRFQFENLKREYLAKNPLEKWKFVRNVNIFTLKFVGCEIMKPGFELNMLSALPTYLGLNYIVLMFYTLYYYRCEPLRALQATPLLGLVIPSLILYGLVVMPSSRQQYQHLYNFSSNFIYTNSETTPKNGAVCEKMAIYLLTRSSKIVTLMVLSLTLMYIVPIYEIAFKGKNVAIVPIILPFVDPQSKKGFYANLANQLVFGFYGVCSMSGIELITCVLKNSFSVTASVIENEIEEFGELLREHDGFVPKFVRQFKNILVKIQDFDRFNGDLANLYFWKFFLQPGLLVYAVSVSIFLYLKSDWSGGLGSALCCYIQLLILCDIGKTVDDANMQILDALNQFPHYLLPTQKQKMLALVLNRMQNGVQIQMGPLSVLNYETATNLTKMIYSQLMFLVQTTE